MNYIKSKSLHLYSYIKYIQKVTPRTWKMPKLALYSQSLDISTPKQLL